MASIRINIAAVAVYFFGLVIVYLAGMSLAGVLFFIFILYLSFPALSFFLLVFTVIKFRYNENFSTDHPYKGEEVVYTLTLANEAVISGVFVKVKFKITAPDISMRLSDLATAMKHKETKKETFQIKFPYRGIYVVGIDFIEIFDVLRWFRFRPAVWRKTFYVYPRIIELNTVFPSLQNIVEASGHGHGIIEDYTLFQDLVEYRSGGSTKHIAWKKFAATGNAVMKEYEKTSWPGVEIYIDLRREKMADSSILEREDCSIEILTALMHYFFKNAVPVAVHAYNGTERYDFAGNSPAFFPEFYESTINLTFKGNFSPLEVFHSDMRERQIKAGTVMFITHSFDSTITEVVMGARRSDLSIFAIINQSGLSVSRRKENHRRLTSLALPGQHIVFVDTIETIKENLEV